eukprot:3012432-Rhodomonas_salina.5
MPVSAADVRRACAAPAFTRAAKQAVANGPSEQVGGPGAQPESTQTLSDGMSWVTSRPSSQAVAILRNAKRRAL